MKHQWCNGNIGVFQALAPILISLKMAGATANLNTFIRETISDI